MLNKNTLGVEKVRGQSEAALQIGMCDQKLCYQLRPIKKRWPSDKANHSCENML